MTSLGLVDSRELMAQHRTALRRYAMRVILHGETLDLHEEEDRAHRMQEFAAIASSMQLTEKEMVDLIYKGTVVEGRRCGCPGCRARRVDV